MDDDMLRDWANTVAHYRACLVSAMPDVDTATIDRLVIDWQVTVLARGRDALHVEVRSLPDVQAAHIISDMVRRGIASTCRGF